MVSERRREAHHFFTGRNDFFFVGSKPESVWKIIIPETGTAESGCGGIWTQSSADQKILNKEPSRMRRGI